MWKITPGAMPRGIRNSLARLQAVNKRTATLYVMFLLATAVSPILSLLLAVYIINAYSTNKLINSLVVGLLAASFAYGVHTTVVADIDRYTNALATFRQTPLSGLLYIDDVYSSVGAHGYNLMAWIVSRLGDDHILRSIVVFIFYSTSSYIVFDYGVDEGWSNRRQLGALAFICCAIPFFNILSYAKSTPAFSIALLAIYLDVKKKIRPLVALPLYILAISFHTSTIPIILLRYAYAFFGKYWKCCFVAVLLIFPLSSLLAQIIPTEWGVIPGMNLLVTALDKFKVYRDFTGWGWAAESQSSLLAMGYRYYYIGVALLYILVTLVGDRLWRKDRLAQYGAIYASWTIAVAVFFAADVFFRYAMPMTVLVGLQVFNERIVRVRIVRMALSFIAGVGLVVQLAYLAKVADIAEFVIHSIIGLGLA